MCIRDRPNYLLVKNLDGELALLERDESKDCIGHATGMLFYYSRVLQCTSEDLRKLLENAPTRVVHICSRKQCPCKEPCAAHFKATAVVAPTPGEGGENDPFQLEDLVQEGHVCVAVQLFLAGARAAGTFCASMKGKAGGCWNCLLYTSPSPRDRG